MKRFDRQMPRVRGMLVARYGEDLAEALLREARQECAVLVSRLPHIGGKKNPLSLLQWLI